MMDGARPPERCRGPGQTNRADRPPPRTAATDHPASAGADSEGDLQRRPFGAGMVTRPRRERSPSFDAPGEPDQLPRLEGCGVRSASSSGTVVRSRTELGRHSRGRRSRRLPSSSPIFAVEEAEAGSPPGGQGQRQVNPPDPPVSGCAPGVQSLKSPTTRKSRSAVGSPLGAGRGQPANRSGACRSASRSSCLANHVGAVPISRTGVEGPVRLRGRAAQRRVEAGELEQSQDRSRGIDDTQTSAVLAELLVDGDKGAQRRGVAERHERHVDVDVARSGVGEQREMFIERADGGYVELASDIQPRPEPVFVMNRRTTSNSSDMMSPESRKLTWAPWLFKAALR